MRFHVLTLFPEMIQNVVNTSILGRAIKQESISVETVNMRDFSANKHMRVDDYPYGGGAGMVIEAEPVYRAVESVKKNIPSRPRVVYLTPQGQVLNQTMVEDFALEEDLVLICGHYEGIDERVLEEVVTDYVSIGDYVLTGGELGSVVMIDAISRFVPGVLSNEESSQFESLQDNLLEYPHYTRPEIWHDKTVPPVLLSGDHRKIEAWRHEQSLQRTQARRPDLLGKSYQVSTAYAGQEEVAELAKKFETEITRYGEMLDMRRKKLRKQHFEFRKNQLLLLFADATAFSSEYVPEFGMNLKGSHTPCAIFYAEPVTDRQLEILTDTLKRRGFDILALYLNVCDSEQFQIRKTAIRLRSMLEEKNR